MRTEPSVLWIFKVASASQGYFCSTISSMTTTTRARERKGIRQKARVIRLTARWKALFIPQRHHRIDLHGAPRGNVAGESCGRDEHTDHASVGQDIRSANAVVHRSD